MANDEDLARIRQGVAVWNDWRAQNPERRISLGGADLSRETLFWMNLRGANLAGADLGGANLRKTNLAGAHLYGADLAGADLAGANLRKTNLRVAKLRGADLAGADLVRALLYGADLRETKLRGADLAGANLYAANLSGADLAGANLYGADLAGAHLEGAHLEGALLESASLVRTDLTNADLTGCRIHGISAWDLKLKGAKQRDLVITNHIGPHQITVDNIEVGQFIYLLLHNEKIRDVIDTITSKVVLILGRFAPERKAVLDALREELRKRDYLPVLFDFDKPVSKDLTGTVSTLANMARFIIADLTDPSSIPHELATVIPNTVVPVQPIILAGKSEYAMFVDFRRRYPWVLATYHYSCPEHLIADLGERVIGPAEAKVRELRG